MWNTVMCTIEKLNWILLGLRKSSSSCNNSSSFAKGDTLNWSEGAFAIREVKNSVLLTYDISDLNVEVRC